MGTAGRQQKGQDGRPKAQAAQDAMMDAAASSGGDACGIACGEDAKVELPDDEMLYYLADLFKAFSDPTRIRILYALMESEMCVACIAEVVGLSQSAISHQLRILRQAHLVRFHKEGKQIIYALSDDHVYTMLSQGITHICE